MGRVVDAATEVTVTVGATEGIFATMQALLNPGDEVVVLEPAFDIYTAQVQMAGGVCKFVPLRYDAETKGEWVAGGLLDLLTAPRRLVAGSVGTRRRDNIQDPCTPA